jgi:hypothetical protein
MNNPKTIIISLSLSLLFSLSLVLWANSGFPDMVHTTAVTSVDIPVNNSPNVMDIVLKDIVVIIGGLALLVVLLAAYFFPSYIALRRKAVHLRWIFMINLFFGAIFGLGWIGTFIWAVCDEQQKNLA